MRKSPLFVTLAVLIIVSLSAVLFLDRVAAFSVKQLTGYSLTYDKWGTPFKRSKIQGMRLTAETFTLKADKADLNVEINQLFKKRLLVLGCEMEGVSFSFPESEEISSSGNILSTPFSSDQKYDKIRFTLLLGTTATKIKDFSASSSNIRMSGNYTLNKKNDDIMLELKISFSPEAAASLEEGIRNNALSQDDNGWYSTVISYKGNAVFLKALYSLATPQKAG